MRVYLCEYIELRNEAVCVCVSGCVETAICACVDACVCVYECMHVCGMCVCVYVYVYALACECMYLFLRFPYPPAIRALTIDRRLDVCGVKNGSQMRCICVKPPSRKTRDK
jgi:hypothetical protein